MIERIGRYEVQGELGRGGFGRVYRAFDPTVGRLVAVKTLNAGGDPDLLTRFRNEAAAAGKLRHSNIVVIHDYGEQGREPYIVMELLEGEDLDRVIRNRRPLSLLQKVRIMAQVAEGLDHAHQNNVVHRDVKPANIMLLPDFTVKIMDFGIALATHLAESRVTKSGTVPGTLRYMAPEQFRGAADSSLSDIFAYGVTFYELLCGQHPFHGPTQQAVMFNIVQGEPQHPHELSSECPEALEQAVLTCLHKQPEQRYPSLRELLFDMKPIMIELQKEHAKGLLKEAQRLAAADQLEAAGALLIQALEVDPGNLEARALREKVQRMLRTQMISSSLQTGQTGAAEIAQISKEAHAFKERQERNARAAAALSECRALVARREYRAAIQRLEQCLSEAADDAEALQLLAYAREQLAAEKRLEIVSRLIREVNTLVSARNFDRAIQMLEIGLSHYPGEKLIEERLSAVRAAKSAELHTFEKPAHSSPNTIERRPADATSRGPAQNLIERIEGLLGQFQSAAAIAAAEDALVQYPGQPALQDLLRRGQEQRRLRQRTDAVTKVLSQVEEALGGQKFAQAIKLVEEGLHSFPEDAKLIRARELVVSTRASFERKQIIDRAVAESHALLNSGKSDQVILLCRRVLERYPDESALAALMSQAKEHVHHQELRRRELEGIEREVRSQIELRNPDGAMRLIEETRRRFPEATSLLELFELARRMKLNS